MTEDGPNNIGGEIVIDDADPWKRLPEETDKAWKAFQHYRDMREHRSLQDTSEFMNHSNRRTVSGWSTKYNWQERVRKFDNWEDEQRIKQHREEHAEKIEELVEQQRRLHKATTANAVLALEHSQRILKEIKQGDRPDFQTGQVASLMKSAAKLAEASGEFQARALGLDNIRERIEELETDAGG